MKHLIADFVKEFITNDQFRDKASNYERAMKTDDWKFLRDTIYMLKNQMVQDILSKRYTTLDAGEKDITQKSYYQLNLIFDFLLNPVGWVKNHERFTNNPNLKGKGIQTNKGR